MTLDLVLQTFPSSDVANKYLEVEVFYISCVGLHYVYRKDKILNDGVDTYSHQENLYSTRVKRRHRYIEKENCYRALAQNEPPTLQVHTRAAAFT